MNAKPKSSSQFDSIMSVMAQFTRSAPSFPPIHVMPNEGDNYRLARFTHAHSFITIYEVKKAIEVSVHKRYVLDCPNDHYADQELIAEVKAYLNKSKLTAKWRIKQDRSRA